MLQNACKISYEVAHCRRGLEITWVLRSPETTLINGNDAIVILLIKAHE